MKITNSDHKFLFMTSLAFMTVMMLVSSGTLDARPVTKKGGAAATLTFHRQRNTFSNMDFFFTNKGILFNNDVGEGLFYPRGTTNFYIFGGGLWFATKKNISGSKRKLCELGYNPNSGVGWFSDGEMGAPTTNTASDYISYVSPRYDKTGKYDGIPRSTVQGSDHWPIWDTAATKTLKQNYYFGDFIDNEPQRQILAGLAASNTPLPNGKVPHPAILSQEEIVNIYTDQDVSQNPEYRAGIGYPFGLNIVEVIYSWSFGRYRDMIFVRRKVTNASTDPLLECFMSGAFDPDIGISAGDEQHDDNSFFGLTAADSLFCRKTFPVGSPYHFDPYALNMGYQWNTALLAKIGVIGFTFLESPVTDASGNLLDISDSAVVGGYCDLKQLGLNTFRRWTINNDPPTPDLRYDFQSSGTKDGPLGGNTGADQRMLFSTGPFTLPPGKSAEYVIAICIAHPSTTTLQDNKDSCVKLIAFAHSVFSDTTGTYHRDTSSCSSTVKSFITPGPPNIPLITTTCMDRGVLVQWNGSGSNPALDKLSADSSKDPLSTTLAFNTYDLYRTTRSDHDSTIRPDGINPTVHLGSWSIWNLRQDSIFTTVKVGNLTIKSFAGFKYTRTNSIPNKIPHSFLDVGDDNGDGVLTGNEGLFNGVQYYYFLLATNEFDSINKVGPLTTAIVNQQNFAIGIPCKPVFPDLPNSIAGDSSCISGAIGSQNNQLPSSGTSVTVEVQDTGKFLQLYSNDTITVSFQPRWTEFNDRFLNQSPMNMFVDVQDTRQGKLFTYDVLFNPAANPVRTPYSFASGIFQRIIGQQADSNVTGQFTTNNSLFAPNQTIDQAFDILVDHQYQQLVAPYRLHSITFNSGNVGSSGIVGISGRTSRAPINTPVDFANIDTAFTIPSFQGGLGESSYEISFGQPVLWGENQFDTLTQKVFFQSDIKDPSSTADFHPMAYPVTIKATSHCDQQLSVIRAGNRNDVVVEADYHYYNHVLVQAPNVFPDYTQPDTMLVPLAGKFAIDAYHFTEDSHGDIGTQSFITKTTGGYYFPDGTPPSGGKFLATVHRLRLGGAEFILNFPGIGNSAGGSGDTTTTYSGPFANDFQPGDKFTVTFTGLMKGLPFPGAQFVIYTSKDKKLDFSDDGLYRQSKILNEVQVVPNPYIVENLGQTSTDNAKLFFTRLPPRATIQIYNLNGELIKTIEHNGVVAAQNGSDSLASDGSVLLADRYNVEVWNLLSEGMQRVGSQVFVARVIAKDPKDGTTVLGEMYTKFAVVLGGFHIVH